MMGYPIIYLTGQRFGRLLVVSEAEKLPHTRARRWLCQCDCGNETIVFQSNISHGKTLSCGCLHKQASSVAATRHGHTKRHSPSPEYQAWSCMKSRCYNPKVDMYPRYG